MRGLSSYAAVEGENVSSGWASRTLIPPRTVGIESMERLAELQHHEKIVRSTMLLIERRPAASIFARSQPGWRDGYILDPARPNKMGTR